MNSDREPAFRDPVFAVDLRALGSFRIAMGLLLLVNYAQRALDVRAHYSDAGVLPREELFWFRVSDYDVPTLYGLSGESSVALFLLAASGLVAIAFTAGYRTRTATVLSWLLLFSLQTRNPLVLNGGDYALRLLLFWSMFLPLGATFSVDSRRRSAPPPRAIHSVASAALLLQVALIYPCAALFKLDQPAWRSLDGFAAAMQVDGAATSFGQLLVVLPGLPEVLSAGTIALEGLGVFAILSPWTSRRARAFGAATFIAFHLIGLGLMFRLGLFPLVMTVAWIPFIPGSVVDRVTTRLGIEPIATEDSTMTGHPVSDFVAGALLLSVLWHNAATLGWVAGDKAGPDGVLRSLHALAGLGQRWSLWSDPPSNRYFIVAAETPSGRAVDLRRGEATLDWTEPALRSRNPRWWKLELALSRPEFAPLRPAYGCYWLREWNARHPEDPVDHAKGWMLIGTRASVRAGDASRYPLFEARLDEAASCNLSLRRASDVR